MPKILIANSYDMLGGAARAAYRLHKGLLAAGVSSRMLSQVHVGDDPTVDFVSTGTGLLAKLRRLWGRHAANFDGLRNHGLAKLGLKGRSLCWLPDTAGPALINTDADIVNLHWVCDGFLRPENIGRIAKPIVWTLHDMWPFCGAEHYTEQTARYCDGYTAENVMPPNIYLDVDRWLWRRKQRAYEKLENLTIVAPSQWLAEQARKSALFAGRRVEVIPYGIDTDRFQPVNKITARGLLGLPQDRKLILFCAAGALKNERKGFDFFQAAIKAYAQNAAEDAVVVIVGSQKPQENIDFGVDVIYLGIIEDDSVLALAYSAVDVMVAPYIIDNLPLSIMEAMACATPVIGFQTGGLVDLIDHKVNGYLCETKGPESIVNGLCFLLSDDSIESSASLAAREKMKTCFSLELQADSYISLFNDIVKNPR